MFKPGRDEDALEEVGSWFSRVALGLFRSRRDR
jgi:hypothetical protein